MTRYDEATRKIDANISILKTMTAGTKEHTALCLETADMIVSLAKMTIGDTREPKEELQTLVDGCWEELGGR